MSLPLKLNAQPLYLNVSLFFCLQQVQTDVGDERSGAQAQVRPGMKAEVKDDSDDDTSVDLEVKTENSETSVRAVSIPSNVETSV